MRLPFTEHIESQSLCAAAGRPRTKKSPSGNHDKEGHAAVASFRTWRGSQAFNPWPLTEASNVAGDCDGRKMKVWKIFGNPLPIKISDV